MFLLCALEYHWPGVVDGGIKRYKFGDVYVIFGIVT
jgi:hypothetical protein